MELTKNNKIINLLVIVAIVITIIGFLVDLRNTLIYPGTDLRNRIVGARLMLEGIDPYFFKWHPGLSARFYDPLDISTELLSKVSVPPTVLALHSAIAGLSYLQQKVIWLIVQWAALLGTVLIFLKTSNSQSENNLILVVSFFLPTACFGVFTLTQVKYISFMFFCYQ
ncbi:hypothetical protein [Pleurocapsa sp. FMAR1]|uniref:hypothetical protein n=1 Tax=Pleurocapsa sp. FMAR1 TaxID=3040204 RepID=UPI0029C8DBD2|nr:hypothetical protein [Pleurocapsa sp. FMAR1]